MTAGSVVREHGTRAKYVVEKCRCVPCRTANRDAESARSRAKLYGRWEPYIDAEPARQHARTLMAQGVGWKRIAVLAAVSQSTVSKLLYGTPTRNMGPSQRIRPETARAILGVSAQETALAPSAHVDADLTWQRIRSLHALGYNRTWISTELLGHPSLALQLRHDYVLARTARAVKELYDRLGDTPAPAGVATTRTLDMARRNGWPRPAEWNDGPELSTRDIDLTVEDDLADDYDEIAVERAIRGDHTLDLTASDRDEVLRRMTVAGKTVTEIARVLHLSGTTAGRLNEQVA